MGRRLTLSYCKTNYYRLKIYPILYPLKIEKDSIKYYWSYKVKFPNHIWLVILAELHKTKKPYYNYILKDYISFSPHIPILDIYNIVRMMDKKMSKLITKNYLLLQKSND